MAVEMMKIKVFILWETFVRRNTFPQVNKKLQNLAVLWSHLEAINLLGNLGIPVFAAINFNAEKQMWTPLGHIFTF